MPDEQNNESDLSSNQEYIIAFLVIGLFGLMYWFFMHASNAISDNEFGTASSTVPVMADTDSKDASTDNSAKIQLKEDEVDNSRDKTVALNPATTEVAELNETPVETEGVKLLAESSEAEDTLRKLLEEKEQALATEIKLKQEALAKLAVLESEKANAEKKSAEVTESGKQETAKLAKELAEAKGQAEEAKALVEKEVLKSKELAAKLAETEAMVAAERSKLNTSTQELANLKQLKEKQASIDASKASQLLASIEDERKVNEAERIKAESAELKLAELEKQKLAEKALNEDKAAQLVASIESERLKAEKIAQRLEETKKLIEEERLKTEETTIKLAQLEKQKAEEEARRLEEEKERKQAEIDRIKAEQELEAIKKQKAEEEARRVAQEKSELEARIKAAQEALIQQERNRLSFPLANGQSVTINQDSFENKLKTSIIDKVANQPLVFDRVYFASGSSALSRQSMRQVQGTAGILQAYEKTKIKLRGHTDNTGDSESNMNLSLARSKKIKEELVSLGIDPTRIQVEGKGSDEPISTNDNSKGRRENRRIDLMILDM